MFKINICSFHNYTFEKKKKKSEKILMVPKKTSCLPLKNFSVRQIFQYVYMIHICERNTKTSVISKKVIVLLMMHTECRVSAFCTPLVFWYKSSLK